MNAHTKLKFHLDRHVYKRGQYKGDAPADQTKRSKNHFRVIKGNGGQMIVRFHNADILTAYEDGHIKLDTRGWHTSPTTRDAMGTALGFTGHIAYLSSYRLGGYSQTAIRMAGKTYAYYDGMEFSADGALMTEAKPFRAKRTDRDETAEFRREIKESGFVGMFPVLYNSVTPDEANQWVRNAKDAMCNEHLAEQWPRIVASIKYSTYSARYRGIPAHEDHKAALKALIASHTRAMTKLVDTDVTVL